MRVPKQCVPIFVGVTVLGLGVSLGYNTGCAINPARDLAPRIFTFLAGWGPSVFTEYNHWWVVPVIACHVGAVVGAWLYYLAVEINWPDDDERYDSVGGHSQNTAEYRTYEYGYPDTQHPTAPTPSPAPKM